MWPHYENRKTVRSTVSLIDWHQHYHFWQSTWIIMYHWPQITKDTQLEESIIESIAYLKTPWFSITFSRGHNCFVYFWNIFVLPSIHIYNLYSSICIIYMSFQMFFNAFQFNNTEKDIIVLCAVSWSLMKMLHFKKKSTLVKHIFATSKCIKPTIWVIWRHCHILLFFAYHLLAHFQFLRLNFSGLIWINFASKVSLMLYQLL